MDKLFIYKCIYIFKAQLLLLCLIYIISYMVVFYHCNIRILEAHCRISAFFTCKQQRPQPACTAVQAGSGFYCLPTPYREFVGTVMDINRLYG